MAAAWVPGVVDREVPSARAAADRPRDPRPGAYDGRGESRGGAPRIHGELLKLGIAVSQATVA